MTDGQNIPPYLVGVGNPNTNLKTVEAKLSAIEARLSAIEDRLVKIDKILYVPPELAKRLLEWDAELEKSE